MAKVYIRLTAITLILSFCDRSSAQCAFEWSATSLGDANPNGAVRAIEVFNGMLIVGGDFTVIGGVNANRIASWDGVQWQALGTGITGTNSRVLSLKVYGGELIASGSFTNAGDVATKDI